MDSLLRLRFWIGSDIESRRGLIGFIPVIVFFSVDREELSPRLR